MVKIEHLNSMDGYSFEEGVAFLALVKAPLGVIKHLQKTHNRSHLHSEIHKMLRLPRTKEILRKNDLTPVTIVASPVESTMANNDEIPKDDDTIKEPNPDENEPRSDKNEPKSNDDTPVESKDEIPKEENSDIILTEDDVRTHKYTRLDQMPNELNRKLYLKKDELFHEMQQFHLKMRNVPEGEEHNEERAKYRAEVLRLDGEIDDYWKQIDAEIERFEAEQEKADKKDDKKAEETPAFNVSTYRSYITKALRKKELSPEQFTELQHRVDAMLKANLEIAEETIEKLKAIGITVG